MKKLFIILAAVTMIFVSCKKENNDNNAVNSTPTIAEQVAGKWLYIEADGAMVETDESSNRISEIPQLNVAGKIVGNTMKRIVSFP